MASISSLLNNSSSSKNNAVYDDVNILPHLAEATNGTLKDSLATHSDGGATDDFKTFQKYRLGHEAAQDYFENGIVYCFITKPNLNLTTGIAATGGNNLSDSASEEGTAEYNITENGFIRYVAYNYPNIINSLTYTTTKNTGIPMFIPLLFNNFVSVSLEDQNTMETTIGETYRGFSQRLPTTSGTSYAGGTVSITYSELATPLITMLHKVWFDYIEKVKFGEMSPSATTVKNKELDYTSSMYFFICGPDGETIKFWARYVGLIPSNMPYGSFDGSVGNRGAITSLSFSYLYSYKEFLQPEILQDFNDVFHPSNNIQSARDDLELFEVSTEAFGGAGTANPDGVNTESNTVGSTPTEKRQYNSAGIYKSLNDFKLIFYDE